MALHFTDTRRGPDIPESTPALRHYVVSRWDAPHDSGLRARALFDPADRVRQRFGVLDDSVVLLRPDAHVAAILSAPHGSDVVAEIYQRITGRDAADAS